MFPVESWKSDKTSFRPHDNDNEIESRVTTVDTRNYLDWLPCTSRISVGPFARHYKLNLPRRHWIRRKGVEIIRKITFDFRNLEDTSYDIWYYFNVVWRKEDETCMKFRLTQPLLQLPFVHSSPFYPVETKSGGEVIIKLMSTRKGRETRCLSAVVLGYGGRGSGGGRG